MNYIQYAHVVIWSSLTFSAQKVGFLSRLSNICRSITCISCLHKYAPPIINVTPPTTQFMSSHQQSVWWSWPRNFSKWAPLGYRYWMKNPWVCWGSTLKAATDIFIVNYLLPYWFTQTESICHQIDCVLYSYVTHSVILHWWWVGLMGIPLWISQTGR